MDDKMLAVYDQIQKEISKFSKIRTELKTPEAQAGAAGIVKGLELAMAFILDSEN